MLFINKISPTTECASSQTAQVDTPIITFAHKAKSHIPGTALKINQAKTLTNVLDMINLEQETGVGTRIWDCTEIRRKIILEKSVQNSIWSADRACGDTVWEPK